MINVEECVRLYLDDDEVSDAMFRRFILDAHARDCIALAERETYWRNLSEARKEREAQRGAA